LQKWFVQQQCPPESEGSRRDSLQILSELLQRSAQVRLHGVTTGQVLVKAKRFDYIRVMLGYDCGYVTPGKCASNALASLL